MTTWIPLSWAIAGGLLWGALMLVAGAFLSGMCRSCQEADETLRRGANAQDEAEEEPMHEDEPHLCRTATCVLSEEYIQANYRDIPPPLSSQRCPMRDRTRTNAGLQCILRKGHSGPCDWPLATRKENL